MRPYRVNVAQREVADRILCRHVDCIVHDDRRLLGPVRAMKDVAQAGQRHVLEVVRTEVQRATHALDRFVTPAFATPIV